MRRYLMVGFVNFWGEDPTLSLQRGDATANVRMEALDIETMNEYFKSLEETLKQHNLMNNPGQIYNVDETGVPLDHRPPNVIARRGQKKSSLSSLWEQEADCCCWVY